MSQQKFSLKEGYGLPIFADGTVRFTILKGGKPAFSVAHGVVHGTVKDQEAHIEAGRQRLQEFVDAANKGLGL